VKCRLQQVDEKFLSPLQVLRESVIKIFKGW